MAGKENAFLETDHIPFHAVDTLLWQSVKPVEPICV